MPRRISLCLEILRSLMLSDECPRLWIIPGDQGLWSCNWLLSKFESSPEQKASDVIKISDWEVVSLSLKVQFIFKTFTSQNSTVQLNTLE